MLFFGGAGGAYGAFGAAWRYGAGLLGVRVAVDRLRLRRRLRLGLCLGLRLWLLWWRG